MGSGEGWRHRENRRAQCGGSSGGCRQVCEGDEGPRLELRGQAGEESHRREMEPSEKWGGEVREHLRSLVYASPGYTSHMGSFVELGHKSFRSILRGAHLKAPLPISFTPSSRSRRASPLAIECL